MGPPVATRDLRGLWLGVLARWRGPLEVPPALRLHPSGGPMASDPSLPPCKVCIGGTPSAGQKLKKTPENSLEPLAPKGQKQGLKKINPRTVEGVIDELPPGPSN